MELDSHQLSVLNSLGQLLSSYPRLWLIFWLVNASLLAALDLSTRLEYSENCTCYNFIGTCKYSGPQSTFHNWQINNCYVSQICLVLPCLT